jgi:hypothetical protein
MASRPEAVLMRRRNKSVKSARLKAKLGLPDLEQAKAAVLVSLRSLERANGFNQARNGLPTNPPLIK